MGNYEKLNLVNGNPFAAEHVAHIEEGIAAVEAQATAVAGDVATVAGNVAALGREVEELKKNPGTGGGEGGGASLPEAGPYQYLVTDGNGQWGTADRLAYEAETPSAEPNYEINERFFSDMGNDYYENDYWGGYEKDLVVGNKYRVTAVWENRTFVGDGVCETANRLNLVLTEEATGDNFRFAYSCNPSSQQAYIMLWMKELTLSMPTVSITITELVQTVSPIDPKFLPDFALDKFTSWSAFEKFIVEFAKEQKLAVVYVNKDGNHESCLITRYKLIQDAVTDETFIEVYSGSDVVGERVSITQDQHTEIASIWSGDIGEGA